MQEMMSEDAERREELYLAQNPGQEVPILHVTSHSPGLVSEASDAAEGLHSETEDEEFESGEGEFDEDDSGTDYSEVDGDADAESGNDPVGGLTETMLGSGGQSDLTPVFIASNDLASLSKLNDPKDFFEEVELLKR